MTYIPHDWWMICQRTGIKFRKSDMRKEWTGLWVHYSVLNPRHPQEFVRSIPDNPAVYPVLPDVKQSVGETTLNGGNSKDDVTLTLTSVSGLSDGDAIGITLDNSTIHWSFLTDDPDGSDVTIKIGLPYDAADGNTVYLPSINNESWA